jgi:adenylate cyclase
VPGQCSAEHPRVRRGEFHENPRMFFRRKKARGVPTALPDHAAVCAQAALKMLENLRSFSRRYQIDWAVRIGMNSGPVIGGIIGTKKFAYDPWGETVNIASRMESHGQPWRIQLTESTRKLLGNKFVTEERGLIEIKNSEPMRVFHLANSSAASTQS